MALVTPVDGMEITRDTMLAPGVYHLPNGLHIKADHVTLDGNGARIIGDGGAGRGVSITQRNGVTVRNLGIEGYYHGIWCNASTAITLTGNRAQLTHELPGPDVFLDVWLDRASAYGGGIFLSGVIDSVVSGNDTRFQQNGIMLYGCENVAVKSNQSSYNSGYGILLYESSRNSVEDNVADYCSRIYHYNSSGDPYHNGADAAGLVIMCSSSHNLVLRNRLRSGGDGVFLGGFHRDRIKVPCNDNVFERNDGSYSPNIAFEATFSQRNVFRNNRAENCNYGFWLGYSSQTTVSGNTIRNNRLAGVAIEHGHHNTIEANAFERNADGCQFWISAQPAFTPYYPDCAESYDTTVRGNTFDRNESALRVWTERGATPPQARCRNFTITDNRVAQNRVGVALERARACTIQGNRIFDNAEAGIRLIGCADISTAGNVLAASAA